ncbi:MAG: pyridoxal 5'-phosphate synthase glutaminase subunit PdxT [Thermoplasmata archaeon]|nr:pyridoxal 5'-phosphate synthase glutaminase subunit PdxT [Thermoplasmata archaeon]
MRIGVLAVQGDAPEHLRAAHEAAPFAETVLVRTPAELESVDRLFLPGGESTTIAGLLERSGLFEPLRRRLGAGLPTFATCAGFILLAQRLAPGPGGRTPPTFGAIDVTLRRNDFGSQVESFEAPVRIAGLSGRPFPGVFIRAPRIVEVGTGATPVAWLGEEVVGVRQGAVWGLTFHPELASDPRLIAEFLAAVERSSQTKSSRAANATIRVRPRATASQ